MALLKFKRSAVPAKIPSIADLALGELAINTYDGKVYTKKDDGTESIVEVGGTASTTNTILLPVRNNTGATLTKGTAVYINGALGQNPTVTKAIATSDATSAQTLGLVSADLPNNTVGNVTLIGSLDDVNTSAYTDGQQLYLSPTTAGTLTATKPYAPNHLVYIAVVEHAHPTQGKLFVKVQNGYEMDELHDVSAQNPANNDGLFYNTTSGLWEKKSIATALGYTPYNASNPAGYTTNTGTVTSVSGTGTVSGLTLTGSVTGSGSLTLGGTLSLTSSQVTTALGYTPANRAGDTFTGVVSIYNSNDAQLYLNGNGTSWAGISWADVSGSDFIWYNGSTSTFAIGGGGSFVANKKLHVHGGMTIGSGLAMSASGTNSLSVEASITANQVYGQIFYDSQNGAYYVDPASTSNLNKLTASNRSMVGNASIFMSSLDANTYYPVTIPVPVARQTTLRIENGLNSNVPPWSTHPAGFSCYFEWTTNGLGWGTIGISRRVTDWREQFATVQIVGGIAQMTNSSQEVIWLRGGADYFFSADCDVTPTVRTTSYESLGQTVEPRSSPFNSPRETATGRVAFGSLQTSESSLFRANLVTPDNTNIGLQNSAGDANLWVDDVYGNFYMKNTIGGFYGDFNSYNFRSAASGEWAYMDGNMFRHSASLRAPIFYDSNDTAYYIDPNATTNLNVIYGNDTYSRAWFRNINSNEGIYNQATGQHWYSDSGSYWNMGGGNINGQGIRFRDSHQGTIRGYVYYDQSNNVGFLNNEGNWRARVVGGDYFLADGSSARAQIFYDSNDTTYYINGAGDSVLNTLYMRNGTVQAKFAQASNFGYSSSYKTVVLGNEYLTTISMGVDVSGNASGSFNGQGEGREVLFRNGVTFVTPNSANNNYLPTFNMTDGYVTSGGSVRAPIFYDSNNTNYYVDAAGVSVLNSVAGYTLRNIEDVSVDTQYGIYFSSNYSTSYAIFREAGAWSHPYPDLRIAFHTGIKIGAAAGYNGVRFYDNDNMVTQVMSVNNASDALGTGNVFVNNSLQAGSSLRAPIFYDSNDTGYYIDPNTTATSFRGRGEIFLGPNTSGQYLRVGGNGGTSDHSTVSTSNGNLHIDSKAGNDLYLNWYSARPVWSEGGAYFPIYYDRNDTSTYINPNGESWIKGDLKMVRVSPSGDNDCFGGLELREVSLVGASQSAATYAPRLNFHWGARAAATIYMDAGGSFVFGGQGDITNNRRTIFCNELYASGNVTAYYSDDRLKTRIGNIENALDIVSSLNGFRYVDNELAKTFGYANNGAQLGVSAQEVQKHLPEIVRAAAFDVDHDDPDHGSKTGENYLTVDYSRLVPLLIEAIKELRDEVEALKK